MKVKILELFLSYINLTIVREIQLIIDKKRKVTSLVKDWMQL